MAGIGVAGMALVPWKPWAGAISLASLGVLVGLNLPFYRYLSEFRGIGFALRAIPFHVLFYLTCGLAGVLGMIGHGLRPMQVLEAPDRERDTKRS